MNWVSHTGERKVQSKAKNNQGCLRSEHKGVRSQGRMLMAAASRWRNETWGRFFLSDTLATDVSNFHTFLAVHSFHLLYLWRHRRSEGDPYSWAKMASPSKATVQLICSMHVAWRKSTQAYEHTRTPTQTQTHTHTQTITGKGKWSLWLTSVLPARNPSQALLSLRSSPESWNGVTHFTPVFSDQPFPPLLAGINEPLPFEHPPHPSLGHPAESGNHMPAHVQASSPPLVAVLFCFVFLQWFPLNKKLSMAKQWLKFVSCYILITCLNQTCGVT